jgi:hypothetical protein
MREIVSGLLAAVACTFIQDRHPGRYLPYLESKRVKILVGFSTARAMSKPDAHLCITGPCLLVLPD